jgi:hypothetical protein
MPKGRAWMASMGNWFNAVAVKKPIQGYAAQGVV